MAVQLINRYIWLVETVRRYGRISRKELNKCWERSALSEGRPLTRRTFYNYRQAVEDVFGVTISCDPVTYEYYIVDDDTHTSRVNDWLLNTRAMAHMLEDARDISDRIFLEEIPSARQHLPVIIEAIRGKNVLVMDYQSFTRSKPTTGIELHPYLVKLFRQRWYVTGYNVADGKIKTYALDRVLRCNVSVDTFTEASDFDAETYFKYSYGIVVPHSEVRNVVIRTTVREAKYLRALPLHPSQNEMVADKGSIFTYRMRLTDDLVNELLAHTPELEVLEPPELRAMMRDRLRRSLELYER